MFGILWYAKEFCWDKYVVAIAVSVHVAALLLAVVAADWTRLMRSLVQEHPGGAAGGPTVLA